MKDEIAEHKQKNAVLAEQLKHLKNSDKQAAKHAEERLKFVKNSQEGEKSLLAQTRRESHDRHEKEKKAFDDRLVAEGRKVAAVEAQREALESKVKEFEARLLVADERAATLNAKAEELAAKLKAETRAKDAAADAEARASTELGEAKIALRQARDQQSTEADELREKHALLEATLETTRAELKAREEKLDEARRASEAAGAKAAECNALRAELEASRAERATLAAELEAAAARAAQSVIQVAVAAQDDEPNLGLDAMSPVARIASVQDVTANFEVVEALKKQNSSLQLETASLRKAQKTAQKRIRSLQKRKSKSSMLRGAERKSLALQDVGNTTQLSPNAPPRVADDTVVAGLRVKLEATLARVVAMEGAAAAAWTALEAERDLKTAYCLDKDAKIAVLCEELATRERASTQELALLRSDVDRLSENATDPELIQNYQREIADLARRWVETQDDRDKYRSMNHGLRLKVLDLRGSIVSLCRVRPVSESDSLAAAAASALDVRRDGVSLVLKSEYSRTGKPEVFKADRVFGPDDDQAAVYEEVTDLVYSACTGCNVCVFAYGPTGSGKTHTMQGAASGPQSGIIPRSLAQIEGYCIEQRTRGWAFEMEVTYVEIYNEQVRDLLSEGAGAPTRNFGRAETQNGLEVREHPTTGCFYVDGAVTKSVDPCDTNAVKAILARGAQQRTVAATQSNAKSSRSHAVLQIVLVSTNTNTDTMTRGQISFVDLGGNENLDKSGAEGKQKKEAVKINSSLSALTSVICARAAKKPHVPYRDSKLTLLLQPALSGGGKTAMIVNVSPMVASASETQATLRFAKRAKHVELGRAGRNVSRRGGDRA